MTGITYTIGLKDETAGEYLAQLVGKMDRPRGFFADVGEHLLNSARDNFDREAGPDGIAWQKLMPQTIKRREEQRLTPIRKLRARGRLAGSLNIAADDQQVAIGSPMPYAAIHQLGGEIQKKERVSTIYQYYDAKTDTLDQKFRRKSKSNFARDVKVGAHTITMPARPYLGISDEDEVEIITIATRWLGDD